LTNIKKKYIKIPKVKFFLKKEAKRREFQDKKKRELEYSRRRI